MRGEPLLCAESRSSSKRRSSSLKADMSCPVRVEVLLTAVPSADESPGWSVLLSSDPALVEALPRPMPLRKRRSCLSSTLRANEMSGDKSFGVAVVSVAVQRSLASPTRKSDWKAPI